METIRQVAAGRRDARHLRLLRGVGRLGGGHRGPRRGRAPLHRQAAVREGAVAGGRAGRPGCPTLAYDFTTFPEVVASARDAYQQAGITDPRAELALAEVHDCFTPTELVLMEDLGFAERGQGWKDVLSGRFDLDGDLPVNPDGGLKAFGHPIGASGLRMMFEAWLQLRGEAPEERRVRTVAEGRSLALTHNLGGGPGECVSFVSVVGTERRPEVAARRFPVELCTVALPAANGEGRDVLSGYAHARLAR